MRLSPLGVLLSSLGFVVCSRAGGFTPEPPVEQTDNSVVGWGQSESLR